jgi:geranylgeranyl reductase family protein
VENAHYPFAIVGAGPAGTTCANALLLSGAASVALIDRARFPRDKPCGDGIGPGVIAILDALDLQHVLSEHVRVGQMAMTSPLGGRMSLDASQVHRRSPLGFVIPRVIFDHALMAAALGRGATDLTGWSLETAAREDGRWHLTLANSNTGETRAITADVLIGADGATSRVRRILGQRFNRDQNTSIAIRIMAQAEPPLPGYQQLDVVKGIPTPGYGWLFSTGHGVLNIGVGMDIPAYKSQKRHLKQILETYRDYLGDRFVYDEKTCKSQILPLASEMPLLAYPDVGAALIGDAASMINPLTGEGIFYGMEAGLQLGKKLAGAQNSRDFAGALVAYERAFLRTFKPHFRGNFYLRKLLERPRLMEYMVRACSRSTDLSCDYIEYMMGNESGVGTKPLYRLALDTVFA